MEKSRTAQRLFHLGLRSSDKRSRCLNKVGIGELVSGFTTVTNQGGSAAKVYWRDECYLSSDTSLTTADSAIGSLIRGSEVAASEQYTFSKTCIVPSTFAAGSYTLRYANQPVVRRRGEAMLSAVLSPLAGSDGPRLRAGAAHVMALGTIGVLGLQALQQRLKGGGEFVDHGLVRIVVLFVARAGPRMVYGRFTQSDACDKDSAQMRTLR